ncbi:hypothetical protein GYA93_13105 [Gordonia desulfuricans]|uniref:Uncharacterized protein n=1 Tax=Gordonia desulfuricans TaxID=89051 RepID=A0A7K3LQI8_9ACTN|nr:MULTISPECIES: hypothetical protein [Gordonia]KOY49534.1 hypothetical protein ISGA_09435 [Gordonia sp. NB41Y]NDK90509.1 hypothetical protein [Gordonia desulfuricans]WLP90421.1 hypothetical protein Q9K23_23415 [Gordonia sp. NB41Y]
MTAMIEPTTVVRRSVLPTREIGGVAWPVYKLHAVVAALVVAVVSLAVFTSIEATAWLSGLTLLLVWWGERYRAGKAATASRSHPAGIS